MCLNQIPNFVAPAQYFVVENFVPPLYYDTSRFIKWFTPCVHVTYLNNL